MNIINVDFRKPIDLDYKFKPMTEQHRKYLKKIIKQHDLNKTKRSGNLKYEKFDEKDFNAFEWKRKRTCV